MKVPRHGREDGIRAARALLDIVAEYSAGELRAAAGILSGQPELSQVLDLLSEFKRPREARPAAPADAAPLRQPGAGRRAPLDAAPLRQPGAGRRAPLDAAPLRQPSAGRRAPAIAAPHRLDSAPPRLDEEEGPESDMEPPDNAPEAQDSIRLLREVVRGRLLRFPLSKGDLGSVVEGLFGRWHRLPPASTPEDAVEQALSILASQSTASGDRVTGLVQLLRGAAARAGDVYEIVTETSLRAYAIQALAENRRVFPGPHELSQLRTQWAQAPLPYEPDEPRERIAKRLLKDAVQHAPHKQKEITLTLLKEGLRGPEDGASAAPRPMGARRGRGR